MPPRSDRIHSFASKCSLLSAARCISSTRAARCQLQKCRYFARRVMFCSSSGILRGETSAGHAFGGGRGCIGGRFHGGSFARGGKAGERSISGGALYFALDSGLYPYHPARQRWQRRQSWRRGLLALFSFDKSLKKSKDFSSYQVISWKKRKKKM